MRLFSPAFSEGEPIPQKYTCDGEDMSPALEWADVPNGTKSFALIVDDPDAPGGLFLHWLIWNIPGTEKGTADGVGDADGSASGGLQGRNGFGRLGYGGPCPPGGTHRYFFHLYALDAVLDAPAGASRERVERAMQGHILAQAELMGRYTRAGRR
jgi:Raf kinase inhibitor-like YbhB/YbcL family protein